MTIIFLCGIRYLHPTLRSAPYRFASGVCLRSSCCTTKSSYIPTQPAPAAEVFNLSAKGSEGLLPTYAPHL